MLGDKDQHVEGVPYAKLVCPVMRHVGQEIDIIYVQSEPTKAAKTRVALILEYLSNVGSDSQHSAPSRRILKAGLNLNICWYGPTLCPVPSMDYESVFFKFRRRTCSIVSEGRLPPSPMLLTYR